MTKQMKKLLMTLALIGSVIFYCGVVVQTTHQQYVICACEDALDVALKDYMSNEVERLSASDLEEVNKFFKDPSNAPRGEGVVNSMTHDASLHFGLAFNKDTCKKILNQQSKIELESRNLKNKQKKQNEEDIKNILKRLDTLSLDEIVEEARVLREITKMQTAGETGPHVINRYINSRRANPPEEIAKTIKMDNDIKTAYYFLENSKNVKCDNSFQNFKEAYLTALTTKVVATQRGTGNDGTVNERITAEP